MVSHQGWSDCEAFKPNLCTRACAALSGTHACFFGEDRDQPGTAGAPCQLRHQDSPDGSRVGQRGRRNRKEPASASSSRPLRPSRCAAIAFGLPAPGRGGVTGFGAPAPAEKDARRFAQGDVEPAERQRG